MKIANPLAHNPFKEFAKTHSLVFSYKFEEDAHTVTRGVTLNNQREDTNLVQGNIDGYDIQLLSRKVFIQKPKGQKHELDWTIMHVLLPKERYLPHVFMDGNNRYHEDVYEHIFTKFHNLVLANLPYTNGFTLQYRVFSHAEITGELSELLPVTLTDKLSSFGHFMDYELLEDSIFVYLPKLAENEKDLAQMLSALKVLYSQFN